MAFQTKLLNGLQEFIDQITEYVKLCVVPVGTVTMYMGKGTTPPKGWLFCDGTTIKEDEYPKLYTLIGDKLPDMTDRFPMGTNTSRNVGTSVAAGLPNITGVMDTEAGMQPQSKKKNPTYDNGCFGATNKGDDGGRWGVDSSGKIDCITFDASEGQTDMDGNIMTSGIVYGKSNTVQPPAIKMRYIIRAE